VDVVCDTLAKRSNVTELIAKAGKTNSSTTQHFADRTDDVPGKSARKVNVTCLPDFVGEAIFVGFVSQSKVQPLQRGVLRAFFDQEAKQA